MKTGYIYLISLNFIVSSLSVDNKSCYTPTYKSGECKSIQNCEPLLKILNNPQRTRAENVFLRDSACGFKNQKLQVCCEAKTACTTPDRKRGVCVPLFECPSLFKLSTEYNLDDSKKSFLHQSHCSDVAFGACCSDEKFSDVETKTLLPSRTECGRDVSKWKIRDIADGVAQIGQYPWLARVEFKNQLNESEYPCLGSLISSRYVLSSAHCFIKKSYTAVNVILGEYDVSEVKKCVKNGSIDICNENSIIAPIEKIILHPDFDKNTYHNNIALIRMINEIAYSDYIKPICLPQMNIVDIDQSISQSLEFVTSGWHLSYNINENLKAKNKVHVKVPFIEHKVCKDIFNISSLNIPLRTDWSENLCTLGNNNKSTCWLDESVSLMQPKNDQLELVGFLLLKGSCVSHMLPDIYTNIYIYVDWIIKNLEE